MAKKSKGLICFILLILAVAVPAYVDGTGTIPDGKYAVKATTLSASSDEVSRLNNSLVNPVNVVVEKGKINAYLTLSRPTKELNTLKISSDGGKNFTEAAVVSGSESATQYMFSVDHLDEPLFASIYVNAMGATPLFRIAFDKSDVEKMKSAAVAEEKSKQEPPAQEAAPQQEKKAADQKPAAVEAAAKPAAKPAGENQIAAVQEQTAVEQPTVTEKKETEDPKTTEEKEAETVAEETQVEEKPTEKSSDAEQKTGSSKMIFVMGGIVGLIAVVAGKKLLLKK